MLQIRNARFQDLVSRLEDSDKFPPLRGRSIREVHTLYIMYADESGDTGLLKSPTRFFALSGLVVHEGRWRDLLSQLLSFRKTMKSVYGLPLRTEIHSSDYIRSPPVPSIQKHQRLAILRNLLDELSKIDYISITNIVVDKHGKPANYDVFTNAWQALLQRFENTLLNANFPGRHREARGLVFVDSTDSKKLQSVSRKMMAYNPIPSMAGMGSGTRNLPVTRIIEDPHHKNSADSYFIQVCDVCSYFLQQKFAPCSYIRRQGATNYLDRLGQALNKRASSSDPLGIVRI